MNSRCDVVIIGAGHNGLVCAAHMAKAGRRVLVLEKRSIVGGSVVTEEFAPGFQADAVWAGGSLRPRILRDLGLSPSTSHPRLPFVSILGSQDRLVIDPDPAKAAEAIRRYSDRDAKRWPEFVRFMERSAAFLDMVDDSSMPRMPKGMSVREGIGLAKIGVRMRLLGRNDMLRFIRMLAMTAVEFLEEWFESEELKAALSSVAVHGATLGPMSAGTGYTFLRNWLNRGGLSHANVGGAGALTQALAETVRRLGGQVRLEAEVERILVERYVGRGVALVGGETIEAGAIASSLDPKRTFLSLVQPVDLPPEFVWKVQSIKMRGSVVKLHLLTDGGHGLPDGTLVVAPSINYLEKAYDAAKYGGISEQPLLEVTTSGDVVSLHMQYGAYHLRNSSWAEEPPRVQNLAIGTLGEYFPKLASSIVDSRLLSPQELEETYGLTEGDLNHGQLMLDQILFMRPVPGWSNHRTPLENLFLCGSGVHGGGGVSGVAGRNAAKVILRSV